MSTSLDYTHILPYFHRLEDPRIRGMITYPFEEILFTAFCAVLCGYDDWVDIALYGKEKLSFLQQFFPYEHGVPSHDVFSDVFSAIDFEVFNQCFTDWAFSLIDTKAEDNTVNAEDNNRPSGVIAIDGKTMRGSHERSQGKRAIHMISAFSQAHGLVLGQEVTAEKSNEITAIPKLLDHLAIEGCTVTIDAMGCQKDIAQNIGDNKADYVLCVKDNHPTLREMIARFFRLQHAKKKKDFTEDSYEETDGGHGRIEVRRAWVSSDIEALDVVSEWAHVTSIAMVKRTRIIGENSTEETHYYITSLPEDAKTVLEATRAHWSIENNLHWMLDVQFGEDASRMRKDNQAKNANLLRKIALNLLKKNDAKGSIKSKRKKAAINNTFLAHIIQPVFNN